jgi:hypothetical protein
MWASFQLPPFLSKLLVAVRMGIVDCGLLQTEIQIATVVFEAIGSILWVTFELHIPFRTLLEIFLYQTPLPQASI